MVQSDVDWPGASSSGPKTSSPSPNNAAGILRGWPFGATHLLKPPSAPLSEGAKPKPPPASRKAAGVDGSDTRPLAVRAVAVNTDGVWAGAV